MPLLNPPLAIRYATPEAAQARVGLVLRAWTVLILMTAVAQIATGVLLLLSGADGFRGPIFSNSDFIPWWAWGATSVATGLLLPFAGLLRNIGATVAVVWYGMWWGLLGAAILMPHPEAVHYPLYPLAVYGFLTGLHILLWAVEFISSNPWVGKGRERV